MRRHATCEVLEPRQLLTTVPPGFDVSTIASGLSAPTAMAFAPDGRLFVAEQAGNLRVIKDGQLLDQPFVSLPVNSAGERGLLGVAFDPNFSSDHYVYLYYTATSPTTHNRVSRFVADGDVVQPGSEQVLLDLPDLNATNHNGGAIHFGPDGKLYVAVGENASPQLAPGLDTPFGKILRINPDGSAPPPDNPFVSQTTGINQAIWAKGLRNPFTFAFQPNTGLILIDDVGQNTTEEIDIGQPGADYGWPTTEGDPHGTPGITPPLYTYTHDQGVAIIGGAFLPNGRYYFGDLSGNFVRSLDPATGAALPFATHLPTLVGMTAGPDAELYLLTRESGGEVMKVTGDFTSTVNHPPTVTITGVPDGFHYTADKSVKLTFSGTDAEDATLPKKALSYTIQRVVNGTVDRTIASGRKKASVKFTVPRKLAGVAVTFRVTLTGTDSAGASATAVLDLPPKLRTLSASALDGSSTAQLDDGSAETIIGDGNAFTATVVVGTRHRLTAGKFGDSGRNAYKFDHWEGAKPTHKRTFDFTVPDGEGDLTFTARYRQAPH